MKCIECNATGYELHHSAACKYLNVDIYKRVEQLQAENEQLEIRLEESRNLGKGHRFRELANAKQCNEYYEQIKQLKTKLKEAETENKRLKEALEEIRITMPICCDGEPQGDYACDIHQRIAIEALKEKQDPKPLTQPS